MHRRSVLAAIGVIVGIMVAVAIAVAANVGLFGLTRDEGGPGHLRLVDSAPVITTTAPTQPTLSTTSAPPASVATTPASRPSVVTTRPSANSDDGPAGRGDD